MGDLRRENRKAACVTAKDCYAESVQDAKENACSMRKKLTFIILSLLLALAAAGCGKAPSGSQSTDAEADIPSHTDTAVSNSTTVPESYMVEGDNYFDYQPGLECSAFASAYLLRHYGEEADGLTLYEDFPGRIPEGGAMPNGIEEFFNERGYEAEFKSDGTVDILKELVSRGAPVIVFIHVEEPYESTHNTHYIPLIGYDADYFYFAESLTDYANCKNEKDAAYNRKTEIAKFERLWANIDGVWDYPYFVINE